jgi:signal transduction histidine kinase
LTIDWVVTPSDWYGGGAFIAIAFDRSELDARERAVYQKERLLLLGEVSTGLAHEMAQPLTVLNVAATILKSDGASASDRESAQRQLLLAADRVRRTVERMKVFARHDSSSGIRRVFSVNGAVESALSLTRNDLVMNGVELTSRIADDDMTAYGDGAMFEQVLLNLIFNARDALRGAPNAEHKTIAVTACIMPDNTVRIRVADTGPGIAMSIRDRIFEPFFTTKSDGTGLGLALSFGIVKEMGGTIEIVESDRGATFQVELPRVQEAGHEYNDVQLHEERLQEA